MPRLGLSRLYWASIRAYWAGAVEMELTESRQPGEAWAPHRGARAGVFGEAPRGREIVQASIPPTSRPLTNLTVDNGLAFEPRPTAAEVAFCPNDRDLQLDNPRFSGAGKASAVNEYDGVRMDEDGDFARRCTVPEPLLNETQSRSQPGLSLQLSNINRIEVLANVVFGISAA